MTDDEITELPFTLFVAAAQLIVGIGLIVFATSAAVRIIGVVVIAFALLTGGSAWYHAHKRGHSLLAGLRFADEDRVDLADPGAPADPGPQETQGPRQPPVPDVSRSASSGPQDPGA